MKKLNKLMAVLLSLTLCLGMVAPAFAASFDDLQNAISAELPSAAEPAPETSEEPAESVQKTEDGSLILGTDNHYGFGWNQTDNRFGIEAWDDDATGRNVLLKESVEHERGDNATITVKNEVNLDLNKNTIQGEANWKPKIEVTGEDASLTLDGNGTMSALAQVNVKDGANLTMKNGTLTGFSNNGVVVTGGSTFTMEDGTITGSTQAGVRVKGEGSSFTMKDGTISENDRGGVRVTEGASFEMNDGTITKNNSKTEGDGSGVWVANSTFKMTGGSITENYPNGGIAGGNAKIELIAADPSKPIEISNNTGIGVHTWGGSTLTMDGVIVKGNTAGRGSGINTSGDKEVTLKNVTLEDNKGGDSAFFSWKTENVKIEDSTIKGNEATTNAVWICYNTAEIKNSDIDGNGANAIGAEYWAKLTVNGKTLYGSYADKVGSDGTITGIKNNYSDFGATILVLDEEGETVGEIKLPQGGDVDKDGNIIANLIIDKTFNENETTDVTVTSKDREDKFTIPTEKQADVKLDKNGVLTGLPENSVVITTDAEGKVTETKLLKGGGIDADGKFTGEYVISKTDNSDDTTTITVTTNSNVSTITAPTSSKDSVELGEDGKTMILTRATVIDKHGNKIALPLGGEIDADGNVTVYENSDPTDPRDPDIEINDPDIEINDPDVPLAEGPVTCAQFVDYLWRHEGSPEAEGDLFTDHEYAPAIAWALSAGLIDEGFQPDELVTVADVRAILGSFASVFGTNAVAADALTTLTGSDGEAVLNCDQVLAQFFGEEYVLPEELDTLEPDIAA